MSSTLVAQWLLILLKCAKISSFQFPHHHQAKQPGQDITRETTAPCSHGFLPFQGQYQADLFTLFFITQVAQIRFVPSCTSFSEIWSITLIASENGRLRRFLPGNSYWARFLATSLPPLGPPPNVNAHYSGFRLLTSKTFWLSQPATFTVKTCGTVHITLDGAWTPTRSAAPGKN